MSDETARKLGIGSVIAGLCMPASILLTVWMQVLPNLPVRTVLPFPGFDYRLGYILGFISATGMCLGPLVSIVLGICGMKTLPGRVGLGLGLVGLALMVGGAVLVMVLQAVGVIPENWPDGS